MAFVLDSSVALAWLLPDERSDTVDALADRLLSEIPVVPGIWPLEVANALLTARRRERLADRDVDRLLTVFGALPVEIDEAPQRDVLDRTVALARRHGITTYDAAYVELAQRRGWPLATLDLPLKRVCEELRIPTLP